MKSLKYFFSMLALLGAVSMFSSCSDDDEEDVYEFINNAVGNYEVQIGGGIIDEDGDYIFFEESLNEMDDVKVVRKDNTLVIADDVVVTDIVESVDGFYGVVKSFSDDENNYVAENLYTVTLSDNSIRFCNFKYTKSERSFHFALISTTGEKIWLLCEGEKK